MVKNVAGLKVVSIEDNFSLVAGPVAALLRSLANNIHIGLHDIGVAEIDPNFSDTAAFCGQYKIDLGQTVNCVIVKASRADKNWYAACLIFGTTKADVNGLVRCHLGARKASFAPMDEAVALTKMEYGGITPVGLPSDWPILVDKAVVYAELVVTGSGIRRSKLVLPGKMLAMLPNAVVLENLGIVKN